MTVMHLIVDELLAAPHGGLVRYSTELGRALIAAAPPNCSVRGVVASSPDERYLELARRLPGLDGLEKSALERRELSRAWQHGFTRLPGGGGMVHAPSLYAPLARHDRLNTGEQSVVTLHELGAWTHPETLPSRAVAWQRAMVQRAERYADAVVVTTHAIADRLAEIADLGDRVRVIGGGATRSIGVPAGADVVAAELRLPERYVVAVGGLDGRRNLSALFEALALGTDPGLSLVVVSTVEPEAIRTAAVEHGLAGDRVIALHDLSDGALAVVYDRAIAAVIPSVDDGFSLPLVEAASLGTPVIHSDAAPLVELAADAGLCVELGDRSSFPGRLAEAIEAVATDTALASRLAVTGEDRARAFRWSDAAEKVWQLHADL